jgi:hypothetical protein
MKLINLVKAVTSKSMFKVLHILVAGCMVWFWYLVCQDVLGDLLGGPGHPSVTRASDTGDQIVLAVFIATILWLGLAIGLFLERLAWYRRISILIKALVRTANLFVAAALWVVGFIETWPRGAALIPARYAPRLRELAARN